MAAFIEVRTSSEHSELLDMDQICLVKSSRGKEGELVVEIFVSGVEPPVVLERKLAEDFLPIFRNHVRVRYNIPHRAAGPVP